MKTLVLVEHNNDKLEKSTLNTISAAYQLDNVDLLVLSNNCKNVSNQLSKLENINTIFTHEHDSFLNPLAENVASFIAKNFNDYSNILFSNSSNGKNIAPRLAGLLDTMIIPDVIEIINSNTFKRPIYAGNAIATCKSKNKINVITIRSTAFEEAKIGDRTACEIKEIGSPIDNNLSKFLNSNLTKSERPELTSAEIVVSGGRGLGSAENFKILEKLADKLGAAMGASRAAVDAGYVPNDWQVGQTGKIVAPNLYIAVGISGAIQHLAGMKDSKVIVGINKDEEAPIFSISDYGLADDLFKAVPEMENKIS
tara:strand:- start:569 stop:1501 length:933 start_codon:yes stop_codon:yes gene_type:complete